MLIKFSTQPKMRLTITNGVFVSNVADLAGEGSATDRATLSSLSSNMHGLLVGVVTESKLLM